MNSKIKRAWIRALRSGKYARGEHALRTKRRYCCLGVLCDLYSKATGTKWEKSAGNTASFKMCGALDYLPNEVMKWAGLASDNPKLDEGCAANYNDDGASFKEIADLIQKHLTVTR